MKKLLIPLLFAALLVPVAASAQAVPEWEYVRDSSSKFLGREILKEAEYNEDDFTNLYRLRKDQLTQYERTSDKVQPNDQYIWNLFQGITGKQRLGSQIYGYATYKDSSTGVLAFVTKLAKTEKSWILAVNANAADPANKKWRRDMSIVLIHESSHLVSLDKTQVDSKKKSEIVCKKSGTYLVPQFGCSKKGSYINAFVTAFWTKDDIAQAAAARQKGKTIGYYADHKSEYVTDYAASSPTEDFAESFTDFVLRRKPAGINEKEKKILFFYQYPKLVELRTQIRNAVGATFQ